MNVFFKNIIKLLIYPISIYVIISIFQNISLNDFVLNNELERKILLLKEKNNKNELNTIICGDSRAERQIIPFVNNDFYKGINVAIPSCDIPTTFNAIKKHFDLKNKIIIISASSWQVNDGAVDKGYFSLLLYSKIKFYERLILYKDNLKEFLRIEVELIKSFFNELIGIKHYNNNSAYSNIINNKGFLGIERKKINTIKKNIEIDTLSIINNHSWYKNLKINGIRWCIIKNTLIEMSKYKSLFIIYNGPITKNWRNLTDNTKVDVFEKEYSKILKNECSKYSNIKFIDFYTYENIHDSLFYNGQHLNKNGAVIFTDLIFDSIKLYVNNHEKTKTTNN